MSGPQNGGHPGMSGGHPGMSGGNPGMSGGNPGMNGGPRPMNPNAQNSWPTTFTPSYEGFILKKAPAEPGHSASWKRVVISPFTVTAKGFASEVGKLRNVPVTKLYDALRTDAQRESVDRVLDDQRRAEPNQHAAWDFAFIKPKITTVRGTLGNATETAYINVILKRQPRTNNGVNTSPLNKSSRIVDTSIPSMNFPPPPPPPMNHPDLLPPPPPQPPPQHQNRPPGPPPANHLPPPPPPHLLPKPNVQNQAPPNIQKVNPKPPNNQSNPNTQGNLHKQPSFKKDFQKQGKSAEHPRQSMEFTKKVEEWKVDSDSDDDSETESDDSEIVTYEDNKRKPIQNVKNIKNIKLSKPPMGHFASGAIPRRSNSRSPPILKHKVSKTKIEKSLHGDQRKTTRRLSEVLYASDDSDPLSSSWDRMDDVSSGSSRKTSGTRGTSHSSGSDDRYHKSYRSHHRDRSRSRPRYHDPRRDTAYRQHRKPSPYHGLSDRESDREDRNKQPIIVHVHNQVPDSIHASRQPIVPPYRSTSPTSNTSLYGSSYPAPQQALPYPTHDDDIYAMATLQRALPAAPMVPKYPTPLEPIRRRQAAAEEYIRSKEPRTTLTRSRVEDGTTFTRSQVEDAYQRGVAAARRRDEQSQWEREEARRISDAIRQRDKLVEQLRRERDREVDSSRVYAKSKREPYANGDRYGNRNDQGYGNPGYDTRLGGILL